MKIEITYDGSTAKCYIQPHASEGWRSFNNADKELQSKAVSAMLTVIHHYEREREENH